MKRIPVFRLSHTHYTLLLQLPATPVSKMAVRAVEVRTKKLGEFIFIPDAKDGGLKGSVVTGLLTGG